MSNFIKYFISLILMMLAGFGVLKLISYKNVKTGADLKKEYGYTCANILKIASAIEKNLSEMGTVPQVTSINDLKKYAERYMNYFPEKDNWGNEFLYLPINDLDYAIASPGSDRIFDGFNQEGKYAECNGEDIIFESGKWKFAPQDAKY